MRASHRILLACAFVLSLVAAAAVARAQQAAERIPPRVLSGDDFGFRVEGVAGDRLVGRFVVRVDGQWVEIRPSGPQLLPLR